jgi:molybdenum cofactor guanylyltransferase
MHKNSEYTAVILAGGKNSRFHGYDKAFVRVFGIPMIERVIRVLSRIFREFVIVTNSPEKYSEYQGVKIIGDSVSDAGPLGGLHSALKIVDGKTIFLVSCDMPFLNAGLIFKQLEEYSKSSADVIIPEYDGYFEPMHTVLNGKLFPRIENFLYESGDKTLINFFKSQNHKIWKPAGLNKCLNPFLNINSFEELEEKGIYGYIAVLGFGKNVNEGNKLIARELGNLLAVTGWGVCVGNTGGTFREVTEACMDEGGVAKLIYSGRDVSGNFNIWPLVEETRDVEHKHFRVAEISMAAIVIGGGEGTQNLVKLFLVSDKPVVFINGTGGLTQNKIPGIVVKNSPREAVQYLNTLL